MKKKPNNIIAINAIALCAALTLAANADPAAEPSIPVGSLEAYPTFVRQGTKPNLTWDITYPSEVKDYVDVDEDEVTPKTQLVAEIRILGTGVTKGEGKKIKLVPAKAEVKSGGSSYNQIFHGTNDDVVPGGVVWTKVVQAGETMRFGGQFDDNGYMGHHYTSGDGSTNIRTLVRGDNPPKFNMVPGAPTLESFLAPYLDSSGLIKIGPMDVICFMELTHTKSQSESNGYDFQDMVLLVTFKEVPEDNGQ